MSPTVPRPSALHRWRPAVLAGAGALALHLVVLGSNTAWSAPASLPPAPAKVMTTRWLPPSPDLTDPLPGVPALAQAAPPIAEPALRRARPASEAAVGGAAPVDRQAGAAPASTSDNALAASVAGALPEDLPAPDSLPSPEAAVLLAAAERQPGGLSEPGDEPTAVPVYATRVPPPLRLSYRLQRGMVSASAVLDWQHDAGAYELKLDARAGPLSILSQHSQGRFDAAGLAPIRFTDQRLRGGQKAANFQRQRGLVSFSGPSVEYPLVPGVQDRLSWMLQLPAIVSAAPQRFAGGEPIVLQVIGARGDQAVWSFRPVGKEPVVTDAGTVQALKFLREPRKPNDTQVEVWLDPAMGHLPVRARIGTPPDGEVFELLRIGR